MLNISRKSCFVVIICVTALILSSSSYARTVSIPIKKELSCAQSSDKPSTFKVPARFDIQYSVTTDGIRADGLDELVKKVRNDYSSSNRPSKVERMILRKHNIRGIGPSIRAQCSSDSKSTPMWPVGTTLTCNQGDYLVVGLYQPVCGRRDNQHTVFTVIMTKHIEDKVDSVESDFGIDLDVGKKDYLLGSAGGFSGSL